MKLSEVEFFIPLRFI